MVYETYSFGVIQLVSQTEQVTSIFVPNNLVKFKMLTLEDKSSRQSEDVNYCESDDEEFNSNEVVESIISETISNATNNEEINKKKQLKKALNKGNQENWKIEDSRSLAKGKKLSSRCL